MIGRADFLWTAHRTIAEADLPYKMLLESMLRRFEYQAALALPGEDVADVPALRAALGMSAAG